MTYGNYSMANEDYRYKYQLRYGQAPAVRANNIQVAQNGAYASGISDAGLFKNKCTDGNNDGKIGFFSALGNATEGIVKGAWNGLTGMLGFGKDENGKTTWNPLKALGTVALGAACVLIPGAGAVACAIGALAGGSQVIKGFKAQANATTDAEAKAAWENIGEGTSTVVGCALGAKASVAAMKGASTAAIDDVAKVASKALKNGDDITTGMLKGLDNVDEVAAALDDVTDAAKAAEVIKNTGKMKNASALSKVDDSLTGTKKLTETVKAFGKDALSSTKNNGKKVWNKTKEGLDAVNDYRDKNKNYKDASKKAEVAKAELDSADAAFKDVKDLSQIDDLTTRQNLASENYRNATAKQNQAQKELNGTKIQEIKNNIAQGKRNRVQAKQDIKDAKAKIKELDKTKVKDADINDLIGQRQAQVEKINNAKTQTPFGKLTTNVKGTDTYKYLKTTLKPDEAASAFKNIKNIKLKDVAGNLWGDGKKIFTALQENQNIQAVINEYGYDDVMQVLQVAYGYGLAEQTI